MYVTLTRVNTKDEPIENSAIMAEELIRWLRDIERFDGFLMLAREGTSIGFTSGRVARSPSGIESPAHSSSAG